MSVQLDPFMFSKQNLGLLSSIYRIHTHSETLQLACHYPMLLHANTRHNAPSSLENGCPQYSIAFETPVDGRLARFSACTRRWSLARNLSGKQLSFGNRDLRSSQLTWVTSQVRAKRRNARRPGTTRWWRRRLYPSRKVLP